MSELIQQLVSSLGISEEQAAGGSGLLLKLVKDKLSGEDFSRVSALIPDTDSLLSAAPGGGDGLMGTLSKLVGKLGGGSGGDLASLASGFAKLGLDPSMVSRFVPMLLAFIQNKGGADLAGLVSSALGQNKL